MNQRTVLLMFYELLAIGLLSSKFFIGRAQLRAESPVSQGNALLVLNPAKADAIFVENSDLLSIPGGTLEVKNSAKFQCPHLIADAVKVSNSRELLIK